MKIAILVLTAIGVGLWFQSLDAAAAGLGGAAAVVLVNLLVEWGSERLADPATGDRQVDTELGVRLPVQDPAQTTARAGLIVLLAAGRFWVSIAVLLIVLAAAGAAKAAVIAGFVIAVVVDLIERCWQLWRGARDDGAIAGGGGQKGSGQK